MCNTYKRDNEYTKMLVRISEGKGQLRRSRRSWSCDIKMRPLRKKVIRVWTRCLCLKMELVVSYFEKRSNITLHKIRKILWLDERLIDFQSEFCLRVACLVITPFSNLIWLRKLLTEQKCLQHSK